MARAEPLVTIVVCTRNRGARLHLALDALAGINSRHEWDVLMVDNASTDQTADVIKSYTGLGDRLSYAMAEEVGLGAARDFAWRLARGEILAFTDDDCYPAPDFVDAVVDVFSRRGDVGLVGGRILLFDPNDVPMAVDPRDVPQDHTPRAYLETASFHGANMAIRKAVLERVGGFDRRMGAGTPFPCEDIDVAAAVSWAGYTTRFDPRPVVYHHHGRREADLAALWKGYDKGRGAYYAKYIMRRDSRLTYLRGWGKRLLQHSGFWDLVQFTRELKSGYAFCLRAGRPGFALVSAPFAVVALALVSATAVVQRLRKIASRIGRRSVGEARP